MMLSTTGIPLALCAAWLACVAPWLDLQDARRLRQRSTTGGRLHFYRKAACWLWLTALVVAAITPWGSPWTIHPTSSSNPWFVALPSLRIGLAVGLAAYFALALWPGVHTLLVPAARPRYLRAFSRLQFVLPVSSRERCWWAFVSVTAGICEEWLYRGFLMAYLAGSWGGPNLGVAGALVSSSLVFGLCHIYQGRQGVIATTIAGLVFGLLALVTGNLALPMLLHVLVDVQVLAIYWPSRDAPERAQALIEGRAGE